MGNKSKVFIFSMMGLLTVLPSSFLLLGYFLAWASFFIFLEIGIKQELVELNWWEIKGESKNKFWMIALVILVFTGYGLFFSIFNLKFLVGICLGYVAIASYMLFLNYRVRDINGIP